MPKRASPRCRHASTNTAAASAACVRQSEQAPEIEAQLAQLNRDYEVNRENYQKLVQRRESAKLSGDLSSATDMLTFRVDRSADRAAAPSGPNRLRLFSLVFVAALVAGLAGAFLMSQVRPTFLSQAALREVTGLPILGSISMNWTDRTESAAQAPPARRSAARCCCCSACMAPAWPPSWSARRCKRRSTTKEQM